MGGVGSILCVIVSSSCLIIRGDVVLRVCKSSWKLEILCSKVQYRIIRWIQVVDAKSFKKSLIVRDLISQTLQSFSQDSVGLQL